MSERVISGNRLFSGPRVFRRARGCTAWLEKDEATVNQRAVQTQSAALCRGATQISSPITDTIASDCSSCVCWSVSRRFPSPPPPEPHPSPTTPRDEMHSKVVSCCRLCFLLRVLFYCYDQTFLFVLHLFIIFPSPLSPQLYCSAGAFTGRR